MSRIAAPSLLDNLTDKHLIDRIYYADTLFNEKSADEIVKKNLQKQKNKRGLKRGRYIKSME